MDLALQERHVNLGRDVGWSLKEYINDNVTRIRDISKGACMRTTPAVHAPHACAHCERPLASRFLCARCKLTAYCSKPCQTAAWKTHKLQCVSKEK